MQRLFQNLKIVANKGIHTASFAPNAKKLLSDNQGTPFIGVYNLRTKEVTIMRAQKEMLRLHFNVKNELIKGYKIGSSRQALTPAELQAINPNDIARRTVKEGSKIVATSHQAVLDRMEPADNKDCYGFTVIFESGKTRVIGDSLTLNPSKPGSTNGGKTMCQTVQQEIESHFERLVSSKSGNDSTYTSTQKI